HGGDEPVDDAAVAADRERGPRSEHLLLEAVEEIGVERHPCGEREAIGFVHRLDALEGDHLGRRAVLQAEREEAHASPPAPRAAFSSGSTHLWSGETFAYSLFGIGLALPLRFRAPGP